MGKGLGLDPAEAKANFNLGLALTRNGRLDEAIPYFQKALALDPRRAQTHYNLGGALYMLAQSCDAPSINSVTSSKT